MTLTSQQLQTVLTTVGKLSPAFAEELETVESLAYERKVGQKPERTSKRQPEHSYLIDTGDAEFKAALLDVERHATGLRDAIVAAHKRLRQGPGPDTSLKGSLLGGEHEGPKAELGRLLKNQRDRIERKDGYTPRRTEPQPKAPGGYR